MNAEIFQALCEILGLVILEGGCSRVGFFFFLLLLWGFLKKTVFSMI